MANQTILTILLMQSKEYEPYSEYTIYPVTSLFTFYAIYFVLAPVFKKKRKFLPILILFLVIALLIPLRIGMEYLFWKYIGMAHIKSQKPLELSTAWWFSSGRLVLIYGIYALLIRLAVGWYESQKMKSSMILEKQASELALLRSQVNPHFLFNTLNNIYSLVYKKSDDAPQAVMKMSAIMRYMLYDATSDHVMLDKEVEYLKSFIELEQLRVRHQDFVELSITGEMEGRTIAPMLLIPFVENAFKHGSKSSGNPGIWITLEILPDEIRFRIKNYLRKNSNSTQDPVNGIGLKNVRRRLNLLYPGNYTLETGNNEPFYHVNLIIKI
jgi:LytS/YehU family sensor histidine kinase